MYIPVNVSSCECGFGHGRIIKKTLQFVHNWHNMQFVLCNFLAPTYVHRKIFCLGSFQVKHPFAMIFKCSYLDKLEFVYTPMCRDGCSWVSQQMGVWLKVCQTRILSVTLWMHRGGEQDGVNIEGQHQIAWTNELFCALDNWQNLGERWSVLEFDPSPTSV